MKTNRVKELDLTKAFIIIISMIGIHTLYHLADYEALSSSVTANVLNIRNYSGTPAMGNDQ